jgi:hypothetical protein
VEKINEILANLTLEKGKGNQAKVASALGLKPQTFGNYLKGRKLPGSLIAKWKEVYGEDLISMAALSTRKSTNVSRETLSVNNSHEEEVKIIPMDVWHELKNNNHELHDNNQLIKEEVRFLRGLVHHFTGKTIDPHKA